MHYFLLFFVVFWSACTTHKDVVKLDLKKIPDQYTASYLQRPDSSLFQNYTLDTATSTANSSFYSLFTIKAKENNFKVRFSKTNMEIQYVDTVGKQAVHTIKGILKRNGHFYCKNVERNLVIPIFYSKRLLTKYRIWLSTSNQLVISLTNINEMNILFLGGGGTFKKHYFFKMVD